MLCQITCDGCEITFATELNCEYKKISAHHQAHDLF